jgi:hypothetical protein
MVHSSSSAASRADYEAYLNTLPAHFPTYTCCVCSRQTRGFGNNPQPLMSRTWGSCCDYCNAVVVFIRLMTLTRADCRDEFDAAHWIGLIRNECPDLDTIYAQFGPRIPEPRPVSRD